MLAALILLQVFQWLPAALLPANNTFTGTNTIKKTSTLSLDVQTGAGASFFAVDTSTPNVNITQLTDVNTRWMSFTPFNYTVANADPNEPAMRRWNITHSQTATPSGSLGRGNQVMTIGYNNSSDGYAENTADASMCDRWESYYNPTGTDVWFERHIAQYGGRDGTTFIRPIAIEYMWTSNADKRRDETPTTHIELQADVINLNSANTSGSGTNRMIMTGAGAFTFNAASFALNSANGSTSYFYSNGSGASEFRGGSLSIMSADANTQYWKWQLGALYMKDSTAAIKDFGQNSNVIKTDQSGNVTVGQAGYTTNIYGNMALAASGGAKRMGTGSFSSSVTSNLISTTAVTANSYIFVTADGTTAPTGRLFVNAADIVPGTSFLVRSSSAMEGCTFHWFIIEPN